MTSIKIYFTDFYSVDPEKLREYGAFNISLLNDLPLFVDPFLLFNSENAQYQKLHDEIIKYMLFLKGQSSKTLPGGLVKGWFHFPEVKQNWLGYSKVGNSGRGLGAKFAQALKFNFSSILKNFGEEGGAGTHLEKLTLVKMGLVKIKLVILLVILFMVFLPSTPRISPSTTLISPNLGPLWYQNIDLTIQPKLGWLRVLHCPKMAQTTFC